MKGNSGMWGCLMTYLFRDTGMFITLPIRVSVKNTKAPSEDKPSLARENVARLKYNRKKRIGGRTSIKSINGNNPNMQYALLKYM